jgi:hypothetical protein
MCKIENLCSTWVEIAKESFQKFRLLKFLIGKSDWLDTFQETEPRD